MTPTCIHTHGHTHTHAPQCVSSSQQNTVVWRGDNSEEDTSTLNLCYVSSGHDTNMHTHTWTHAHTCPTVHLLLAQKGSSILVKVWHCHFAQSDCQKWTYHNCKIQRQIHGSTDWAFLNRSMHIGFPETRSERRASIEYHQTNYFYNTLKSYLATVQTCVHLQLFFHNNLSTLVLVSCYVVYLYTRNSCKSATVCITTLLISVLCPF